MALMNLHCTQLLVNSATCGMCVCVWESGEGGMEGKASQVLGDSDGWLNSFLKIHNKQYMYHIAHLAIKSQWAEMT